MTPDHARFLARYNSWQNANIHAAVEKLDDALCWADRGLFFRSIAETLNHMLGDDGSWMALIEGRREEAATRAAAFPHTDAPRDWTTYLDERGAMDVRMQAWAEQVTEDDLTSPRTWWRADGDIEIPVAVMAAQMFNHGTHHRGQVHGALTGLGIETAPTDIMAMWLGER